MSVVGKDNLMADIPSRSLKDGNFSEAQNNLPSYFNSNLPLPQNHSWKEYRLPAKVASRVVSCLRGYQFLMESLRKLPGIGRSVGVNGPVTANNLEHSHAFTQ